MWSPPRPPRRRAALAVLGLAIAAGLLASTAEAATFRTPSGNIRCGLYSSGAICVAFRHTWQAPSKPASCDGDWGDYVRLDTSGPGYACLTDVPWYPARSVLRYGSTVRVGRFQCTSRVSGVTCRDRTTGAAFVVSRDTLRFTISG